MKLQHTAADEVHTDPRFDCATSDRDEIDKNTTCGYCGVVFGDAPMTRADSGIFIHVACPVTWKAIQIGDWNEMAIKAANAGFGASEGGKHGAGKYRGTMGIDGKVRPRLRQIPVANEIGFNEETNSYNYFHCPLYDGN